MKNYKTTVIAACLVGVMGACAADGDISYEGTASEPRPCCEPDDNPPIDTQPDDRPPIANPPADPIDPPVEPPVDPPVDPPADPFVEAEDLSADELQRVEILRDSINIGLDLGTELYLDQMAIQLQNLNIIMDYNLSHEDLFAGLDASITDCPFVEFYDNVEQANSVSCDYLADMAKVEVYSSLTQELDAAPLTSAIAGSIHFEEAQFWYEQGAISALEDNRVRVRFDLMNRGLCSVEPTPVESSYIKGIAIGRQHFAQTFNLELERRGFAPSYPEMPIIEICDANEAFIEPAMSNALGSLGMAMEAEPLCASDYTPPNAEASLQWAQAQIDYERGVRQGLEDEMALAAVAAFRVIPCNVGDPLVIDLDGDGIELSSIVDGVNFDLYNIGREQAMAWPNGGDGFLAYDWNGDGVITSGAELFGNVQGDWTDGFDHLASFDLDMDNLITKNDKIFSGLVVWQDFNQDGLCAANELSPLASFGVSAVPTIGSGGHDAVNGNPIPLVAWTEGEVLLIGDAELSIAPNPRLARLD